MRKFGISKQSVAHESQNVMRNEHSTLSKRTSLHMCVNTVCLRFSHEFTQFSQSFFFLEFRVKNVFRIKYLESFM